jgi:hypothetical protein
MHSLSVLALAAASAAGNPCEERLREVEARLSAAHANARGVVYHAQELPAFEPATVAGAAPLESKMVVVQIGVGRAWLDGDPASGLTMRERLATLSARINKLWDNYRLLQPKSPPDRRLYVMFDRRVTARDAAEVVAVIGREDRLVPLVLAEPLAKRRLWCVLRHPGPTPSPPPPLGPVFAVPSEAARRRRSRPLRASPRVNTAR